MRFVLLIFLIVPVAAYQISLAHEPSEDELKTDEADNAASEKTDWSLLHFGKIFPDPKSDKVIDRKIIKIVLLLRPPFIRGNLEEITIDNKDELRRWEIALMGQSLRIASISDDETRYGGFAGGGGAISEIKVFTTDGEFVIGICSGGFLLNYTGINNDFKKLFFSYYLTQLLDKQLKHCTGRGLSEHVAHKTTPDTLSGLTWLGLKLKEVEEINEEAPGK